MKVSLCILMPVKCILEDRVSHEGEARLSEVSLKMSGPNEQWLSLSTKIGTLGLRAEEGRRPLMTVLYTAERTA